MDKRTKDLTGKMFGKLRVLEITNKRRRGKVMWRVQCTGGCNSAPYLISSGSLISGNSTQCQKCHGKSYIKDLTGKTFGKLKVLEITDKRSRGKYGAVMWKVQCTGGCNNDPYLVSSDKLISGNSTQCKRCSLKILHSKNSNNFISKTESLLIDRVEKYVGTQVVRQFRIENRFYDAYIPSLNLLIESNGKYWHSTKEAEAVDEEKKRLAKEYGFNLVPVTNNNQKDIPVCFEIIKKEINELFYHGE